MTSTRRAGYNERRCIARDVLGFYGSIVAVAKYDRQQAQSKKDFQVSLSAALQRCIERHAALRTVVKASTSEQPLVETKTEVNLSQHLTILEPVAKVQPVVSNVASLLTLAHAHPLSEYERHPQWRVWSLPMFSDGLISGSYLAFATSHVLINGMSTALFHETLLGELNGSPDVTEHRDTLLAPALDKAAVMPISWSFLLKPLLQEKLPPSLVSLLGLAEEHKHWFGARKKPQHDGRLPPTSLNILAIDHKILSNLLKACKKHNTRLTSLLNLTTAQALTTVFKQRGSIQQEFMASTPCDLRRLAGAEGRMANHVSAIQQLYTIKDDSGDLTEKDWRTISAATSELQSRAATLNDHPIALLKYLDNFKEWVSKTAAQPATVSFAVSNIGTFKPARGTAEWTISEMAFSQSADATGAPLNINVVSADKGALFLIFTWWPGMLGVEDEETFVHDICQELERRLTRIAAAH